MDTCNPLPVVHAKGAGGMRREKGQGLLMCNPAPRSDIGVFIRDAGAGGAGGEVFKHVVLLEHVL